MENIKQWGSDKEPLSWTQVKGRPRTIWDDPLYRVECTFMQNPTLSACCVSVLATMRRCLSKVLTSERAAPL